MMRGDILAWQAETDKIRATPLGAVFFKFKSASERAWIADTEDGHTDKNRASTKRYHEELAVAEAVMRKLILMTIVEENDCPGHLASPTDPKVCGRCGTHIDSLRS